MKKQLRNPYVLISIGTLVWFMFLIEFDVFTLWEKNQTNKKFEEEVIFYQEKIDGVKKDYKALTNDERELERFAREKYFFKKEGEDIYYLDESRFKD